MKEFHTSSTDGNEPSALGDAIQEWKRLGETSVPTGAQPNFDVEKLADSLSHIRGPKLEFHAPDPPANQKQAAEQIEHLAEMRVLVTALTQTIQNAEDDRAKAQADRAEQRSFNKRMTVVAVALSFAAVVAPFLIYFLEHGWWWEMFRP